jgi:7,8-dihydro-6-hydroxymethylpterin dimethyltransferase
MGLEEATLTARSPTEERLIHETTSLCKVCKNSVPARVMATASSEVWMRKACPEHGEQEVRLSTDAGWYERTRSISPRSVPPRSTPKPVHHGCPFDCGACELHEQKVRLPVLTITSACNLDCPICYVHNKNDGAYHMAIDDFRKILGHLREEHGEVDIINFTGGEPLMHPQLFDFLELARDAGVHRVTVCSNGIKLARDEATVERLAALGARVALSFDTFEEDADYQLQGARLFELKMRALDLLAKHGVDTTLIPVMTRGVNDHEIGKILDLALRQPNIRHIEVHTITYTGQGGASFPRSGRISMLEVLQLIEAQTGGLLRPSDFVPSPCAHPLCYQIAYLLLDPEGGPPVPFTRFLSRETLYECLSDRLYIEPGRRLEAALGEAIDGLWAQGAEDGDAGEESARTLRILKSLLARMFPKDRPISRDEALRVSEASSKAVYIHSHMDEETFDTERIVQCCDSNCYADGSTVPVCSYNVLYREKEDHFMLKPAGWNERRGGRKHFGRSLLPILP